MPKNYETTNNRNRYFSECFDDAALPNVRSYLIRHVVEGQPEVYDTPFARGESTKKLLSTWMESLKSISDKWPTLWEFEVDLAKKVGPMSVRLPLKDRMKDIDHYYEDILLSSAPISDTATASVIQEWSQIRGLRVRNQKRTVEVMKKSTNSGSPYFTKRRLVVSRTIPCETYIRQGAIAQSLPGGGFAGAAVLGWRGQEGGPTPDDVKQRVVWMFPFACNIQELQLYQPLIESAQKFNLCPAWVSMDSVDMAITRMFDTKRDSDLVVCTDFSRFDQHFNTDMQNAALQIISSIVTRDAKSTEWLERIFPIKYMIPLIYDVGRVRFGKHGMGSGSGGTNCDETLVHRSLQYEAAQSVGAELNPNSQCLGDDGVLTYPGITVEDVVKAYSSHGQEMNEDKQYASTQDCTYLRRWHHKDYRVGGVCVGVYSTCRALGRLRYLERFQDPRYWSKEAVALRQLSILENVKWHPLKEEFVDFCAKRDKYRLGVDLPGFLDNIRDIGQSLIEQAPDFLGYTKTLQSEGDPLGGIENWWIVKYLKSL